MTEFKRSLVALNLSPCIPKTLSGLAMKYGEGKQDAVREDPTSVLHCFSLLTAYLLIC